MDCSDYTKLIYLFDEINQDEKQKLTRHLQTCKACLHLFEQRSIDQNILSEVFRAPAVDEKVLTARIMRSIEEKDIRVSLLDRLVGAFDLVPVRHAFVVISVFIVGFFISEYNAVPADLRTTVTQAGGVKEVTLSPALFEKFQTALKAKPDVSSNNLSLLDCIQACRQSPRHICLSCFKTESKN
jgi:hypothetical protein